MSSPEDLVRSLYRAMNDDDWESSIALAHPDVEWVPDARVPEGPARGRDRVVAFFRDRAEPFDRLQVEIEEIEANGDLVLALIRVTGSGQASGAEFDIRIAHVWEVRDGLLVRGQGFGDRDRAREAAGLA
jgi:uncharacterized protein